MIDESDEEFLSTTKSYGLAGLADLGSILSYFKRVAGGGNLVVAQLLVQSKAERMTILDST